jgi:hypothetical protein
MSHLRQLDDGRWQATIRLPDGKRRSATRDTRRAADQWARHAELVAQQLAEASTGATLTWSPDGLTIFVPEDLLTMDAAAEIERALRRVLNGGA